MKWRNDFVFDAGTPVPLWLRFADAAGETYAGGTRAEVAGARPRGCLATLSSASPLKPKVTYVYGDKLSSVGGVQPIVLADDTLYVGGTFYTGLIGFFVGGGSASWHGRPVCGGAYDPGYIRAVLPVSDTLLVGGNYISADGGVVLFGFAEPNNARWKALKNEIDTSRGNSVNALALAGTDKVAVGGKFFHGGSLDLNSIGLLDLKNAKWTALGTAPDVGVFDTSTGITEPGYVSAIVRSGDTLYVGGTFDIAGDTKSRGVAAYDMSSGKWSDLDGGVTGAVNAMLLLNGKLVVGGFFNQVGSVPVKSANVAYWDITNSKWVGMDGGVTKSPYGQVMALHDFAGYTLVGGDFDSVGSGALAYTNCALWDWA